MKPNKVILITFKFSTGTAPGEGSTEPHCFSRNNGDTIRFTLSDLAPGGGPYKVSLYEVTSTGTQNLVKGPDDIADPNNPPELPLPVKMVIPAPPPPNCIYYMLYVTSHAPNSPVRVVVMQEFKVCDTCA